MRTETSRNVQNSVPYISLSHYYHLPPKHSSIGLKSHPNLLTLLLPMVITHHHPSTFPIATNMFAPASVTPTCIWFLASSHLRGSFLFSLQICS
ncbi:hypothetical protein JHK82_018617 [Glycine max]|uniref:Uncharacterized protein n=2 Tax=Glycine subgen. Soja TaxID=1462606 RepID=A0A0R0JED5_SOYBN|nr:hypothetical protein JHK85_019048 [Glycine max]KAG5142922.1 hypothetical protein JHK82_018617 [Glycine max]KRH49375.1 hypothetical protein GLYMA_07G149700v4 [Glycine max]RZC03016.1 hypothetical protein D0Y65_017899 [Glycine soja]